MSDLLSQSEIDALLKAGLGGSPAEEEDIEPPRPARESAPYFQEDFDEAAPAWQPQPPQKKFKMRRSPKVEEEAKVNVQEAVFESFDEIEPPSDVTNLEIILNLTLEIRVELGKTKSTVKEVLEMGSGSVIELQKLNGEPVDLLINKKQFAKGEMIVIGENFGVRVTDIDSIPERIEALQ
ncbi:MAG: FliM/FliN family flagellar motor switch protein [Candidatus Omnitrophota bacterium]